MAEDAGTLLVKLQADIGELKSGLNEAKGELSSFKEGAQGFMSSLSSILKLSVAGLGIYELGGALKNAFREGIEAVDEFRLGVIAATANLLNKTTAAVSEQESAYAAYKSYVLEMYETLENEAYKHFAAGKDMIAVFYALTRQGIMAAQEEAGAVGVVADMVKLLHHGYADTATVMHELRGLVQGYAGHHYQLAQILKTQIGPEWHSIVQDHIKAGDLLPFLAEQFKGLAVASGDIQQTLMSQRTTLYTLITQIGRGGLASAYEDIVGFVRQINDYLREHKEDIIAKILAAWRDVKMTVEDVLGLVRSLYDLVSKPLVIGLKVSDPSNFLKAFEFLKTGRWGLPTEPLETGPGRVTRWPEAQYWKSLGEARGVSYVLTPMGMMGFTEPREVPPVKPGIAEGEEGGAKSRVSAWQAELEQMKIDERAFFDFSKEREREFWTDKLALCEEGSEEYLSVRHKLFSVEQGIARDRLQNEIANLKAQQEATKDNYAKTMEIEDKVLKELAKSYGLDSKEYQAELRNKEKMAREHAKVLVEIEKGHIETTRKLRELEIDSEKENLKFRQELGAISEAQEIAGEQRLLTQKYMIDRQALLDKMEADRQYEKEYAKHLDDLRLLDKKYHLDLQKLEDQRVLAVKKQWDQVFDSITRAFSMSLQGIITGTTTLRDALRNIFSSILSSFVEMLMQMVTKWVSTWLFELIYGKITALDRIKDEAGVAYAAAYASICAIPVIGPSLAPSVAAASALAALAGGMAFVSALGGWDVPADSLALVHKREMVLPPDIAEPLRERLRGGGGVGPVPGGGGSGGPINVNFSVQAFDSEDVLRFFKRHGDAIAEGLRDPVRNYKWSRLRTGRF
jgi:hypothetical protein